MSGRSIADPTSRPVSDGKLLYVIGDSGVAHALEVKTGNVIGKGGQTSAGQ
ncbi:MAG TPA: hypothetical protein VLD67_03765 [Vicinamibacterales bacterium]|nr:hypothetical protein [Vicinamibacterales bacterium]